MNMQDAGCSGAAGAMSKVLALRSPARAAQTDAISLVDEAYQALKTAIPKSARESSIKRSR